MYNIIFDFDGTLFRTETVDIAAINNALYDMGVNVLSDEEILSYIGMPLSQIAKKCLKTKSKEDIELFIKKAIENELILIPRFAKMYPFAIMLLEELSQKGHKLAICSNGNKEYILKLVEHFKLDRFFEAIWYKRYGFSKKRGAEIVFERLRNARKTFFVGDRKEDITVARKNGFLSIGLSHGFGKPEELRGADYLAENLEEVYRIITDLEEQN
jgi:phosphoglycolate phosphatase